MSDTWVTLLAGLGGALIGALAAIGAQALANRQTRSADRRREAVDLVARFWDAADRLWRSSEGLEYDVMVLGNASPGGDPAVRELYEGRRLESLAAQHAAETEGLFLIAQMRLLHPEVAEEAQALLDASSRFEHGSRDAMRLCSVR